MAYKVLANWNNTIKHYLTLGIFYSLLYSLSCFIFGSQTERDEKKTWVNLVLLQQKRELTPAYRSQFHLGLRNKELFQHNRAKWFPFIIWLFDMNGSTKCNRVVLAFTASWKTMADQPVANRWRRISHCLLFQLSVNIGLPLKL